jgi:hypothetical protein
MSLASVTLHNPDRAEAGGSGPHHWLRLFQGYDNAAIHTTEARAAAMAFAFNNPEAVLRLASVLLAADAEVAA